VTAIDLAKPLIEHARRRRPDIDYRVMDATRLELQGGSFDAALFSYNGLDVIHPVAERRRCLDEIFRVLGPGGVFIMSTHNAIGHLFSGGYYYLRGYWNAARIVAAQCRNPYVLRWYFRYDDPGGAQLLFSAPPGRTRAQLVDAGFIVADVRAASGERNPGRIRLHQPHVYFVARKTGCIRDPGVGPPA
jgi:SAM-dependent methyltransferase